MNKGSFYQEVEFNATPKEVYEILMDSKKHSAFAESKCEISRRVRGRFKCYDGYIEGENIKLEKDKKIVQKWRAEDFPEGYYSTVIFMLGKKGDKTLLKFSHEDVPKNLLVSLKKGWEEHYWNKIKRYLSKN